MSVLLPRIIGIMEKASTLRIMTEKPYDEFTEFKAAIIIDRILVPLTVGVGFLGNFLSFVTLVFTSLRTTSTCVYMAAIAVLDCVILIYRACTEIALRVGHPEFYFNSRWTCGFFYSLFYFAIHMNVLVLLAMTVDRFIVVKFPLKAQSICTPKSAIKVMAGIAVFSFALNFQVFFHRRLVPTKKIGKEEDLNCWYPAGSVENFMMKVYTIIDASIYSFIPFVSLLILNSLIIRELKNPRKEISTSSVHAGFKHTDGESGFEKKVKENQSIIVMLLLVSFAFLLLTSPIVIMYLVKRFMWLPDTSAERARFRLVGAFTKNLMFSNHSINFLLYCVSGRRFRKELKQLFARLCCRS